MNQARGRYRIDEMQRLSRSRALYANRAATSLALPCLCSFLLQKRWKGPSQEAQNVNKTSEEVTMEFKTCFLGRCHSHCSQISWTLFVSTSPFYSNKDAPRDAKLPCPTRIHHNHLGQSCRDHQNRFLKHLPLRDPSFMPNQVKHSATSDRSAIVHDEAMSYSPLSSFCGLCIRRCS